MTTSQEKQKDARNLAIDVTKHSIADIQNVIRAYDTKAQVLIGLVTFQLGVLLTAQDHFTDTAWWVLMTWLASLVVTIALCGFVLYPKVPVLDAALMVGFVPRNTYFLANDAIRTPLKELVDRFEETDWLAELVYESRKLAFVRSRKGHWFRWALRLGAVSMGFFFAVVTWEVVFSA